MKIYVISMARNEEDIIESFVRHSLTFADKVIIAEHLSQDNTARILELLVAEGLPLAVEKVTTFEAHQAKTMTELARRAYTEGADVIVPLDADEFLLPEAAGGNLRQILETVGYYDCYQLSGVPFFLQNPDDYKNRFLLANPSVRNLADDGAAAKVVFGAGSIERYRLTFGNHALVDST